VLRRTIFAAWDGSSWSALGSGMDGDVNALTVYDNKLTAAGYFNTAGGVEVTNGIAALGRVNVVAGSGQSDMA